VLHINLARAVGTAGSNGSGFAEDSPLWAWYHLSPVIAVTTPVTTGIGQTGSIPGVSLSETGNIAGEIFTVALADDCGVLSADTTATGGGGTITPSNDCKTLTIAGTLAQVDADLTTLTDADPTAGSDTITVTASDSLGSSAAQQQIAVTVNGRPTITVPATAWVGQGQAASISGVSVAEAGNTTTSGEIFTVVLADTNGVLSAGTGATGGGGTITPSSGGETLTISGTLIEVDADLTTLTDTDGTTGADTITVNASDSFGNSAVPQQIEVTALSAPVILAPASAVVGVNQPGAISGLNLTESGTTWGTTFTVTLTDAHGDLSATGPGVSGSGTTTLTIGGLLNAVNADLATLTDTDDTTLPDTITINASDSLGNTAAQQQIAVTVNGLPTITAPATTTLGIGRARSIGGVSLSESGDTSNETFTVTVADTNGVLSASTGATGGGGTITSSSNGTTLTITGTLAEVDADLGTLTDIDSANSSDTITVNASDSFGNAAVQRQIAITVNGLPDIAAPATATVGVGRTGAIGGVGVAETGNTTTSGETFTIVLADHTGVLSASAGATGGGGTIIPSNGGTTLTITGTLAEVDADLTTLTDTDGTTGSDTITVTVSDSFGNSAARQQTMVTVNGLPTIAAPATATVGVGVAGAIGGVSLSESGDTSDEAFTLTLAAEHGDLSATGTGVSGSGTTGLTITGSLQQVNADLATLTDADGTNGSDTITLSASDGFGNAASETKIAVTVNALPTIVAPAAATLGVGRAESIGSISLSESGNTATSGEIFTVTLADANGVLSAGSGATGGGGTIIPSNGGTTLTITGTLAEVDADLTSLTDSDGTTVTDTITVNASDSFGNTAVQQQIDITVNSPPGITTPATATLGVGQASSIDVSLSESGDTSNEIFTVTLADNNGVLSANSRGAGGGGTITPSNGGTTLTISGTLPQVDADLASLTDTDATATSDTIRINARDSFGNAADQTSIAVTVNKVPATAAPATATFGVGRAGALGGIIVAETGNTTTSGETFALVLADTKGVLSASTDAIGGGGKIATSNGGNTLTIRGTLAEVDADLTTLKYTGAKAGSDTITIDVSDSFGNAASETSIAVTVNGLPDVTTPAAATLGVGRARSIDISLSESGDPANETFTVTLADGRGVLSANSRGAGGGGTIAPSNDGRTLTITGTLAEVEADLATLTDDQPSAGSDTITVSASDSFGNAASRKSIAVTVNELPAIAAPAAATVGVGRAGAIAGIDVAETGNTTTSGETFSVVLTDDSGLLSANANVTGGGGTITGADTTTLTVIGTLAQVDADLQTLTDSDATAGSDTITLKVIDSFGNKASETSIAVTVNELPAIAAPMTATVGARRAGSIPGISLSETGNTTTSGEAFTVVLTDTDGVLSANTTVTGGGGMITPSDSGKTLTIAGTLAEVDADLQTLTDSDATAGSDTITIDVSDSFGNAASETSIAVTVNGLPAVTVPAAVTVGVGQAGAIVGVGVAETGNTTTSGEIFTVVLTDAHGVLSASAGATGGGTITPSNGGKTLTISGTLAEIEADLTTLADDEPGAGSDAITVTAGDNFGNAAREKSIAVTVNRPPAIAAPPTATVGAGRTRAIGGVKVTETGNTTTSGETFTVVLTDRNGVLSASTAATGGGGMITPSNGGKTLTISGTLAEVDADLTTLTDSDATAGSGTITVNTSDSFGNKASETSIAVTVNGLPGITVPATATLGAGRTGSIPGISLSETGNTTTSGEIFTVVLADTNGVLSVNTTATGGGGTIGGAGTTTLTVTGTLAQVDADLQTFTDTDARAGSDRITFAARDSFGNEASRKSIAVTVNEPPAIAAPGSSTVGVGRAGAIGGVNVVEIGGTTSAETFTVVLADVHGVLSASTGATGGGGTITPSNGGKTLTIAGTLIEVEADLTTVTDDEPSAGSDRITVTASDSFGNAASEKSIAVTVNRLPTITAPAAVDIDDASPTDGSISGVSVSETGNTTTSGETFTVVLADDYGTLSASTLIAAGGGRISASNGGKTLTITGTLVEVDADLQTLTDHDLHPGSDTITVNATDSFGNTASQQSIAVTVGALAEVMAPAKATSPLTVDATSAGLLSFRGTLTAAVSAPESASSVITLFGQAIMADFSASADSADSRTLLTPVHELSFTTPH
jgi:hypothetical protein